MSTEKFHNNICIPAVKPRLWIWFSGQGQENVGKRSFSKVERFYPRETYDTVSIDTSRLMICKNFFERFKEVMITPPVQRFSDITSKH